MNSSNLQNRNLYADVTVLAVSMPRIFVPLHSIKQAGGELELSLALAREYLI